MQPLVTFMTGAGILGPPCGVDVPLWGVSCPTSALVRRGLLPKYCNMMSSHEGTVVTSVLVVEDDRDVRKGLAKVLRRTGFAVTTAENGRVALDEIERHRFQVIVSDIKMPVMDGIELYQELRRTHPETARRVLFVTAWSHESPVARFLADIDRPVLEKPFEMADFVAAVRSVAAQAAQRPTPVHFSPDEAQRIREMIVTPGSQLECPRCGTLLRTGEPVAGGSVAAIWELHCESCHRSMIVRDLPST